MKQIALISIVVLIACAALPENPKPNADEGKKLAFDRNKGNCLACHAIEDGSEPGNIGPPLKALSLRFADKSQLREQIDDATLFNPDTSMPPFGKNAILTAEEIDKIVDYLWTLQ